MEVLFWFPTVRTVTCWGGALGAAGGETRQSGSTNQAHFIVLSTSKYTQWKETSVGASKHAATGTAQCACTGAQSQLEQDNQPVVLKLLV